MDNKSLAILRLRDHPLGVVSSRVFSRPPTKEIKKVKDCNTWYMAFGMGVLQGGTFIFSHFLVWNKPMYNDRFMARLVVVQVCPCQNPRCVDVVFDVASRRVRISEGKMLEAIRKNFDTEDLWRFRKVLGCLPVIMENVIFPTSSNIEQWKKKQAPWWLF